MQNRECRDEELVDSWQAGIDREEIFRQLFDRYAPRVYAFLRSRGLDAARSEELTQEVFLRAHGGLPAFRRHAAFSTWLFRIARNQWLREIQRAPRETDTPLPDVAETEGFTSPAADPLERLLRRERRTAVTDAIAGLPASIRRCVVLRIEQELSYREISRLLNLSSESVRSYLFQARRLLRRRLVERPGERPADPGDRAPTATEGSR
ncbi:MAG: RNA polymerase sigma factor [Holophagales bacterium]|nr:RNA polymerase sigma factor [Holophagales bacterium]